MRNLSLDLEGLDQGLRRPAWTGQHRYCFRALDAKVGWNFLESPPQAGSVPRSQRLTLPICDRFATVIGVLYTVSYFLLRPGSCAQLS